MEIPPFRCSSAVARAELGAVCDSVDRPVIGAREPVFPCRGLHSLYLQLLSICSVGASLVAFKGLGQAIYAAGPLARLKEGDGPEQEERGDRRALDTVLVYDVCAARGPEGQGAGLFRLSISRQVREWVIKETVGKDDSQGLLGTQPGPGQQPPWRGPRCAGTISRPWSVRAELSPLGPWSRNLGPRDERWGSRTKSCGGLRFSMQPSLVICAVNAASSDTWFSLCPSLGLHWSLSFRMSQVRAQICLAPSILLNFGGSSPPV